MPKAKKRTRPATRSAAPAPASSFAPAQTATPPAVESPEGGRRGWVKVVIGLIVVLAGVEIVYSLKGKPKPPAPVKLALLFEFGSKGSDKGQFDLPQDLAVDAVGSIYVTDRRNTRIEKFNPNGEFAGQWGGKGQGHGLFAEPFSVAVDPQGKVWVLDGPQNLLQRFEPDGTFLTQFMGDFYAPASVTIDGAGNLYVANTGGANIRKYSLSGERLATISNHGEGKGDVADPNGVAVDADGSLFVADTGNRRIEKLSADGRYLDQWRLPRDTGGGLRRILVVGNRVYATDESNHCVWVLDRDLRLIGKATSLTSMQGERKLESPNGLASDRQGNLYITDVSQSRVFKCALQPVQGQN